jgi:predicted small lipoprotein YifL
MRNGVIAVAAFAALLSVAGCKKEGPAEKAGQQVDKLGDKVQDTVDPPKGPLQAAGRSIDRATGNT